MVRTRDTASLKVAGGKATRKITHVETSSSDKGSSDKSSKYSGGNPYCPRETPSWQKAITNFFPRVEGSQEGESSSTNVENESVPKNTD